MNQKIRKIGADPTILHREGRIEIHTRRTRSGRLFAVIAILLVLASGSEAETDTVLTLTLSECIERARKNSPEIAMARENFRRRTLLYQSYRSGLFPRLELSGNAPDYTFRADDSYSPTLTSQSLSTGAGFSVEQMIVPTGGKLTIFSGMARRAFFGDSTTVNWNYGPGITFSQPLAWHIPSLWEWRIQNQQHDLAKKQYIEATQTALVQLSDRFFALYHAQYNLESARRNAAVNDTIYQLNQGRYSVGRIAENDLLESELALLNAHSSIETAILERDRAQATLKNMLGIEDDRMLVIDFQDEIPLDTIDVDAVIRHAHAHGTLDALLRTNRLQNRSDISAARSNVIPSARLEVTAGLERNAPTLDALARSKENVATALKLKVPLLDWGQNSRRLRAAQAEEGRMLVDSTLQKKQLEQAVRFLVRDLDQYRRQIAIAQKSDMIAARRLEVAINRYVIGKIDIREIRAAQNERDAARRGYISNLQRFWRTWYELRRVTLFDAGESRTLDAD